MTDKYYSCDVAYSNTRGFLAPHRNVQYWLGDYHVGRLLIRRKKFNHTYPQLKMIMECAYEVLKQDFRYWTK